MSSGWTPRSLAEGDAVSWPEKGRNGNPMTIEDIAARRLAAQGIEGCRLSAPEEAVARMGAIQAQDYEMAKWAIGLRTSRATRGAVQAAIDRGRLLRAHLLRPTWHFVTAADYGWIHALTAPRIRAALRSRHLRLELTDALISKSEILLENKLGGGKSATREALVAALEEAGIPTRENRGWHVLVRAELDGVLCSGPDLSGRPTYALRADRVSAARVLPRDEALAALAGRYFAGHGPATLADFVWWSGLPAADAKRALEAARRGLESIRIDSAVYWFAGGLPSARRRSPGAYLLPAYDEYILGYRDRGVVLSPRAAKGVISTNGVFWPVVLAGGQAAGLWRRRVTPDTALVEVDLFSEPERDLKRAIASAAGRYGRFLGAAVETAYAPKAPGGRGRRRPGASRRLSSR